MTATDVTAWLALILSVISLYRQWNDKRPRLDIRPGIEARSLPTLSSENKNVPVLSVYLSNPAEKPIYIKDVWLVLNKGQKIQIFEYNAMYPRFLQPFTIDPLRGRDVVVRGQQLAEDLQSQGYNGEVRAIVSVEDETGKQYKSKPFQFSIAQLLET